MEPVGWLRSGDCSTGGASRNGEHSANVSCSLSYINKFILDLADLRIGTIQPTKEYLGACQPRTWLLLLCC